MVTYDKEGNCTRCGLPACGFVVDGVCECLEDDYTEQLLDKPWYEEELQP